MLSRRSRVTSSLLLGQLSKEENLEYEPSQAIATKADQASI